ncbi:alpha/beta fold hydrolase [Rhizobium rhizogenes]|uniref:alpha/beta fold hydrolase n=1 Tax=Rhizobium rhizogenes TaxID=359 RepID=UPI001F18528F|nr:alpha/beta hydrolase [Rhizobium rhizogenes]
MQQTGSLRPQFTANIEMESVKTTLLGLVTVFASFLPTMAMAQSMPDDEMFDPAKVIAGIQIDRSECQEMEARQTAVWVSVEGKGYCLRYYAAGLNQKGENPVVAAWMPGDVMGGPKSVGHQEGIGVATMIEQSKSLSDRYSVPWIFLARPGSYGSSGKHYTIRHKPLEAKLMAAQIDALKARYHIGRWALGGHSGGGTLAAEFLARRNDLQCVILSSAAAAYRERLKQRGFAGRLKTEVFFDPYDALDQIPKQPDRRVIMLADPRETNIPFSTQKLYFDGLKLRGHTAFMLTLKKAAAPKYHSLVDFGEAATGMCANGTETDAIFRTLRAMPPQSNRITN